MRAWPIMLGGLIIWAAHFFALYAIGSIFPGSTLAFWLSTAASVPAALADLWILWVSIRRQAGAEGFDRWIHDIGAIGAGLSLVAVIWQSLPGLIV